MTEIRQVFATFGLDPIEKDAKELRDLMAGGYKGNEVVYRTVLTNGTGGYNLARKDAQNAQLERDAS